MSVLSNESFICLSSTRLFSKRTSSSLHCFALGVSSSKLFTLSISRLLELGTLGTISAYTVESPNNGTFETFSTEYLAAGLTDLLGTSVTPDALLAENAVGAGTELLGTSVTPEALFTESTVGAGTGLWGTSVLVSTMRFPSL